MTLRAGIWCAVSSEVQATDEKISIEDQEATARELCKQNGWIIGDVFRIVHSRFYIDIHELNNDLRAKGNNALERLMNHWQDRDLDIIIVRDSTRLGRMQTLVMHMVESTIASGMRIYSIQDGGMVDENNYRIWAMMGSFKAATEIDRLVKARKVAMKNRAQSGLHTGKKPCRSHRAIRDPITGKTLYLELNPEYERLWVDFANLIIEGVSWASIGHELYTRFGHVQKSGKGIGKTYTRTILRRIITHPQFWGHTAYGLTGQSATIKTSMWRIEPGHPIPEGVTIKYNTIPAVYTGDLADRVKQALYYRSMVTKGATTRKFTRLLICADCGYTLRYSPYGYRCHTRWENRYVDGKDCVQSGVQTRHPIIEEYMKALLERVIEVGLSAFEPQKQEGANSKSKLELVEEEITSLENKAERLVGELLNANHDQLLGIYNEQLEQINEQLRILRSEHEALQEHHTRHQNHTQSQETALEDVARHGLEDFWQQDERYINKVLHNMMGDYRFIVKDTQIIGINHMPNLPKYK